MKNEARPGHSIAVYTTAGSLYLQVGREFKSITNK